MLFYPQTTGTATHHRCCCIHALFPMATGGEWSLHSKIESIFTWSCHSALEFPPSLSSLHTSLYSSRWETFELIMTLKAKTLKIILVYSVDDVNDLLRWTELLLQCCVISGVSVWSRIGFNPFIQCHSQQQRSPADKGTSSDWSPIISLEKTHFSDTMTFNMG